MTDNEIWKVIQGYSKYEVSNKGNVRNIKTQRILKQISNGNGQLQVKLTCESKKPTNKTVSRIVALHFIDNPNNLKRVSHISNNYSDNSVENLRFS